MIRRQASLVGTGDQGFVLAWLKRVDASGNQTLLFAFENKSSQGVVSEQPVNNIKFTDGSPDVIPELE